MTFTYQGHLLRLAFGAYGNGSLAVEAVDAATGEPWATLSVNMPPYDTLPQGVFYLKDWSENAGIAAAFIDSGLIEPAGLPDLASGFVRASAYRFVK